MGLLSGFSLDWRSWEEKECDEPTKKKLSKHIEAGKQRVEDLKKTIECGKDTANKWEAKYKATTEYKAILKDQRIAEIFEEILSNGINPTDETINRIYKKRYELKTNINVEC